MFDVHVDSHAVYWVQKAGRLHRGSLDGAAPALHIGQYAGTLGGEGIRSDETHVYFLDGAFLRRWPKATGEPCSDYYRCPSVEDTALLWEHPGGPGPLFVDGRYVYVAMDGCAAITRYDKQEMEPVEVYVTLPEQGPGNGPTTLEVDGKDVYCASWGNVFKIPWWDEPLTTVDGNDPSVRLAGSEVPIWAMVLSDEHVYWVERPQVGETLSFGRVPRQGGTPQKIEPPEGVFVNSVSNRIVYDSSHRRVFFSASARPLETTWRNTGAFIAALSTDTLAFTFYARENPTGHFAIDERYLYWTSSYLVYGVRRMPLDTEPLYVIEP